LAVQRFDEYILGIRKAVMGAWNSWENPSYSWVVICKNKKAHWGTSGHKIPLAQTDAFESLPVSQAFMV
jgi:hypothetical protein